MSGGGIVATMPLVLEKDAFCGLARDRKNGILPHSVTPFVTLNCMRLI